MMRKLLLSLCLILGAFVLKAQQTYTIKVTDAKTGNPVSNASVTVRSTKKGVSSGNDGNYSIQARANDVLEITSVGYKKSLVTLSTQLMVTVSLEATSVELEDVVVLGTRGVARAKTETAVPVDVIRINQVGLPTAKSDLTSVLNMAAPSFNYNKQSGADGADHIDLGTLRGLGPDQTLVLINGKRRHQTAFVALFGTRGRGASGSDLNAFPQSIVDRIEILRDGASAQYGSDAMAGVINVVLKKDVNHLTVTGGWSGYYDTKFNAYQHRRSNQYYSSHPVDGGTVSLSLNDGFNLGKNGGFINLSVDLLNQEKTFRQADTINWQNDKDALPYINGGRRAFGDGSVKTGGAMYNMEIPTSASKKTTFYSFGGYNYKASDAYAYTRNYSSRPNRFPVTADGTLVFDTSIMRIADDGEIYYNPRILTHIEDISFAAGVKSKICKDWNWDLSNTFGRNDFHFYGDKTFNASQILIPGSIRQTRFDDGGFNFLQNTTNLDVSKSFSTVASGLNLGLGAEFRYERYSIYEGELASFENFHKDPLYYPTAGDFLTPASGSQGFPGFTPEDAIKSDRNNISLYVDAELNATKEWLMDGAVRFEHYSDFGSVATFKFATRYKITKDFNLRGSVSTGFRAPSLQQINFRNSLTSFSGGKLVQSLISRNGSALTQAAGIPNLKEETSVNGSIGFSWKPIKGLTITADGYMVKVKDRVVLSGLFSAEDATLSPAFLAQIPVGVSTVQFFANAVNTTNSGVDIVIDYSKSWNKQSFKALLAGNFQNMTINDIHVPSALNATELNRKTFYSDREVAFLKASAPKNKFSLSLEYNYKKCGIGTHLTYFGAIKLMGFGDATTDNPNQTGINPQVPTDADGNVYVPEIFDFKSKLVTDVFISYKLTKKLSIFAGADNLFNVHPNLGVNQQAKGWFGDNESGGPWDSVQMGFNGLRLFGKVALTL
ncbi:MAG TPA: TonB-dependent receptor [Ferruginibacter sp.]|nr:TonB-dependent receptor [Ferruginibacter sp.]